MRKRLFIVLVLLSLCVGFFPVPQKTYAAVGTSGAARGLPIIGDLRPEDLPRITRDQISISFVNRGEIKLTVTSTAKPVDSYDQTYGEVFSGNYYDRDFDDTWRYKKDSLKAAPAIDELVDSGRINSAVDNPEHMNVANVADIQELEVTLFFIKTLDGEQDKIVYLDNNFEWQETNGGPDDDVDFRTNRIEELSGPKITNISDKSKFNLVGRYVDRTIVSFEEGSRARVFNQCSDNTFKRDCNSGSNDPFLTLGPGSTIEDLETGTTFVNMAFSNGGTISVAAGANTTATTNTNAASAADNEALGPDCYTGISSVFAWLICPALGVIDNFIEWAERTIIDYLNVDLGSGENINQLRSVWAVFARLASALLVIIALAMIISTALNFGMFDAYTVKKVLPRLVIAGIGIWISFSVILAYIEIMNVVGRGIGDIMLAPFGDGARDFSLQNIAGTAGDNTGIASQGIFTGLAVAGAAGAIAGIGGVFGLISLAITVAFAFIVAIVVLTLRQMIIILLLIMAPLGIAAWILPNTDNIWKLWSGTLNKLLLMFPMIVALLASGKIFAYIFAEANNDDPSVIEGFFDLAIPLIAYVIPFFLLPTLFKAAGGAFSRITGMVNNKSKGVFDRGKNWADNRQKESKGFKREEAGRRLFEAQNLGTKGSLRDRARAGQFDVTRNQRLRDRSYNAFVATGQKAESEFVSSEFKNSGFDSLDAKEQTQVLRQLATGQNAQITRADGSKFQMKGGTFSMQTEAAGQLVKARSFDDLRMLRQSGAVSDRVWQSTLAQNKGDVFEKAPDLAIPDQDYSTSSAESLASLHGSSIKQWKSQFSEALASNDKDRIRRFTSQLQDLSDPKLRQKIGTNVQEDLKSPDVQTGLSYNPTTKKVEGSTAPDPRLSTIMSDALSQQNRVAYESRDVGGTERITYEKDVPGGGRVTQIL